MTLKSLLAASALVAIGTAASATTVTVSGTSSAGVATNNEFRDEMAAAFGVPIGSLTFWSPSDIFLNAAARLTFTEVGAESSLNNGFAVAGLGSMTENGNFGFGGNFLAGGPEQLSGIFAGGSLNTILSFFTQGVLGSTVNPGGPNNQFGVYVSGVGPHTTIFLAFDDAPGSDDDNHDDYVIRMDVSAVPIPAAGFLLIGALGGLALMRRRKAV